MMIPTVRSLLAARRDDSPYARRRETWHLALVIEGGGMRGVVAGGMVTALEKHGLLRCFDSVHGSSAGACAAAYFTSGQAALGTRIYYEDINNNHFISAFRPIFGRSIMDTSFLIDKIMRETKPLDVSRILARPGLLNIVTTNCDSGLANVYNNFTSVEHFFDVLKATITLPVIAGPPVTIDGVRLVDGGMAQQIPLQSALMSGASHVLVLMTRKQNELERRGGGGARELERVILGLLYGEELAELYRTRNEQINETIHRVSGGGGDEGISIDYIARSPGAIDVGRLTTNGTVLRAADLEARAAVDNYLLLCA